MVPIGLTHLDATPTATQSAGRALRGFTGSPDLDRTNQDWLAYHDEYLLDIPLATFRRLLEDSV